MMYSEFYEMTKTDVSAEEYRLIEDSYYDFDGNKQEFCKQWLKDKKSGAWAKELKLRRTIEAMKAEHKRELAERDDTIAFYSGEWDRQRAAIKAEKQENERLRQKLTCISNKLRFMADYMAD